MSTLKLIQIITFSSILFGSCSVKEDNEETDSTVNLNDHIDSSNIESSSENFSMVDCLKSSIPEYFESYLDLSDFLNNNFGLDKTPNSYSKVYKDLSCTFFVEDGLVLSQLEKELFFEFKYDIGLPLKLYSCTEFAANDLTLLPSQIEFYRSFNNSILDGGMDTAKLSEILAGMDDPSFNSNGVSEVAFFYLVYEIFNCSEVWGE